MIFSDIKKYFASRKVASLQDLSFHFNVEPDAVRGMLEQWIHKGKMYRLPYEESCQGCCGCGYNSEKMEFYQWID